MANLTLGWAELKKAALSYNAGGAWPPCRTERALARLVDYYGESWVEGAVPNQHPLIEWFWFYPGVTYAADFLDLLHYLRGIDGPQKLEQVVRRTKTDPWSVWSVAEEVRVLWFLNSAGVRASKTLEHSGGKHQHRTLDLEASIGGAEFGVEVTRLGSLMAANRAELAAQHLSHLALLQNLKSSIWLAPRPYSKNHLRELEDSVQQALKEASVEGVASVEAPGVMRVVAWSPDKEKDAVSLLAQLGMLNQ